MLQYRQPARAFALRFEGQVVAYLNRCAHVPTEMDWQEGEFLDSDKRYIISEKPGDGSRMKLVNNLMAGINLVGAAEAFSLGIKGGLDPHKIIEAIGLTREEIYIANVIKCRPPGNRNPEPDEVEQCEPFLFRQIDAIRPKVIVALGKFAAQSLLRTTEPITKIRGREFQYRDAILIPTYHPAYLLRNPPAKRDVWEDMKRVRAILNGE